MAKNAHGSKTVIYAALVGNLLVAVTKFAAAALTGSSSMLSEGVHSVVDTGNQALLLYGYHRSSRAPDARHPLGYGRELYFWSFIVALLLFSLGAGVSIYEGIMHVAHPEPIKLAYANYIVLALSFVFEGVSWYIAFKAFRSAKGELGYWEAVRKSKDPPSFMVLFEDSAALAGIVIAAAGTYATDTLQQPALDGVASILIGLVLAGTATVIARESKGLLIGEQANPRVNDSILHLVRGEPGVEDANGAITIHLAPDQIVAALSVEFADDLRAPDIEASVVSIENRIRAAHPEVMTLFIKPQTRRTFEKARDNRYGVSEPSGA